MYALAIAAAIAASPLPAPGTYCPTGGGYGPVFVGPGPRDLSIDGLECHDARRVQGKIRARCFTNNATDKGGTYPLDLEVLPSGELSRYGVRFRRLPHPGTCPAAADATWLMPPTGVYCPTHGEQVLPLVVGEDGGMGIDGLDCKSVRLSRGRVTSARCYANGGSVVPYDTDLLVLPSGAMLHDSVLFRRWTGPLPCPAG